LIELASISGRGQRYSHGGVGQAETIALHGRGRRDSRRIFGRVCQQSLPAQAGEGDDRNPPLVGYREYVALGAAVRSVVTNHQKIELPGLRPAGSQRTLVTGKADQFQTSLPLLFG